MEGPEGFDVGDAPVEKGRQVSSSTKCAGPSMPCQEKLWRRRPGLLRGGGTVPPRTAYLLRIPCRG